MTATLAPPDTRVETLLEIACAVNSELDLDRLFWVIYEQCTRLFDTRNFLLLTCDPDGRNVQVQIWFYHGQPLQQRDLPGGVLVGLSPEVIRTGQPLNVDDYAATIRGRGLTLPPMNDPAERLAWMGAPLMVGERLIGVIATSRAAQPYTEADARLLQAIAAQCAVAIENANLVGVVGETAHELIRRTQELASLNAVATAINRSLDLQTVLGLAADNLSGVTGWEMATIRLWNPLTRAWELGVRRGVPPALAAAFDAPVGPRSGLPERITPTILAGRPLSLHIPDEPDFVLYHQAGLQHLLCLPVATRGQVLGVLVLGTRRAGAASDAARLLGDSTLAAIGEQLAVAIENARLRGQARQAAALEERHRLARDLHDSVTQTLFTVTLMAEAAQAMIGRDPERVPAYLTRLKDTAHSALAEMRALLGQLRPQGLRATGLGAALRQHAATVGAQVGLAVEVVVDDDLPELPPAVEEALYRIAQEALHNVVKHAGARHAVLRLGGLAAAPGGPPTTVTLAVEDDGRGFDPVIGGPGGGLGLVNMRERAAALGGQFAIAPTPGGGTMVTVAIPLG